MVQLYIMSLLRKKAWWQRLFFSRITLLVLAVLCVMVSFAVYDRYEVEREMYSRRVELEEDLNMAENRRAVLEEKVDEISHERGVEAEIRRNFDVAREGEKVVVLVEPEEGKSDSYEPLNLDDEKKGWWSFLTAWWPF